jgi:hypothetical protein
MFIELGKVIEIDPIIGIYKIWKLIAKFLVMDLSILIRCNDNYFTAFFFKT